MKESDRREEAWAVFQARYQGVIRSWCLRRGLAVDEAEDLTQEILLKLFRELPRYRHDARQGHFRSWLKAVVNNAITDSWRRQQRRAERGGVGGTTFLERLAGIESPEAAAELSELIEDHAQTTAAKVLERVRAKVKETTWQAFYQTMVEERPAAQVAGELGLRVATIYKANYRVKQMLLEEYRHVHTPR
jgi:RNA polymerase sigma-70 factor (ECF subfamily)